MERIEILHACVEMEGLFTPVAPRISVFIFVKSEGKLQETFFVSDRKYISRKLFFSVLEDAFLNTS